VNLYTIVCSHLKAHKLIKLKKENIFQNNISNVISQYVSFFFIIFSFFATRQMFNAFLSFIFYSCYMFWCLLIFRLTTRERETINDLTQRGDTTLFGKNLRKNDRWSLAVIIFSLTYALESRERHTRNTHTLLWRIYNVGNPTRYSNCRFSTGHRGGTLRGTAWCQGTIILSFHRRHHHRHLAALILPVSGLNGRICHNPFQHLRQCRQWVAIMTCSLPPRS